MRITVYRDIDNELVSVFIAGCRSVYLAKSDTAVLLDSLNDSQVRTLAAEFAKVAKCLGYEFDAEPPTTEDNTDD